MSVLVRTYRKPDCSIKMLWSGLLSNERAQEASFLKQTPSAIA